MSSEIPPFDITPTDEQQLMLESLEKFAINTCREEARSAEAAQSPSAETLRHIAEMGLSLLSIPSEYGGIGEARSPISSALFAETLAQGDMGIALAGLAPTSFVNTLVDQAPDDLKKSLLPDLAAEMATSFVPCAVAHNESEALFDPHLPNTKFTPKSNDYYEIRGAKYGVPLGASAKYLLVTGQDPDNIVLGAVIDTSSDSAPQTSAESAMGLKSAGLANIALNDFPVSAKNVFPLDIARLVALSRLGSVALGVGTCKRVTEFVTDYCNERVAFGEPISHRQSVAFKIADMGTEVEALRLLLWKAATAPIEQLAHRALLTRIQASKYTMQVGTDGVQLLGGHGFVKEHPVELWYRDLRSVGALEGLLAL